jgi:6-phosphogluconolactonase
VSASIEQPLGQWQRFGDPEALARHVADWVLMRTTATDRAFAICLSGGSTPRRLYQLLASPPLRDRMPWNRLNFFFGDERFVPPDHPDSNFRMVREALFDRAPVPAGNIHAVPTLGLSPQDAADAYGRALAQYYGASVLDPDRPLFDLTLLGLGEDGHTASLFPGNAALNERARWAVAVIGARDEARITLTYPALESSAEVAFLVAGKAKRDILARVRAGEEALPAARVRPVGRLHWFADAAALPG